jgi:hypothetical protein
MLQYGGSVRIMKDLKLYYDGKVFDSFEAAQTHFLKNWATDNPQVKRQADTISESEVSKQYQAAHYRDGHWYFCTEVKNFMNFNPTQNEFGADNIIKECPRCKKPGLVRAGDWLVSEIYLHISAVENNKETAIIFCLIPRQKNGGLFNESF